MKRIALALTLVAAMFMVASVSDAAPTRFFFVLSGAGENPANTSPGTGSGFADLDTAAHTLHVNVVFGGLTTNTVMAHIHCCTPAPGNTGVATPVPAFPGFPLGVTSGAYDHTLDLTQASSWNPQFIMLNGGTPAGAEAALAAGAAVGQAYFNIHTTQFPGGEIRGFLAQGQGQLPGTPSIPTLSGWAFLLLGVLLMLSAFVYLRRRAA
jgi:CHRD domain/IPTL-CTERM motif